jgi:hypothetical protein
VHQGQTLGALERRATWGLAPDAFSVRDSEPERSPALSPWESCRQPGERLGLHRSRRDSSSTSCVLAEPSPPPHFPGDRRSAPLSPGQTVRDVSAARNHERSDSDADSLDPFRRDVFDVNRRRSIPSLLGLPGLLGGNCDDDHAYASERRARASHRPVTVATLEAPRPSRDRGSRRVGAGSPQPIGNPGPLAPGSQQQLNRPLQSSWQATR